MAKTGLPGKPVSDAGEIPRLYRRMFNSKPELFNEWQEYYQEGLTENKPDAREWAWFRFGMKYLRDDKGRWYKRPDNKT